MAGKGTAQLERLKRREDARVVREDHALKLYASGLTFADITNELADTFGTSRSSTSNTIEMVRRALRRHAVGPEDVDLARSRMLSSLDVLLEAWMPRAIGQAIDPATGLLLPPSDKAANIVLGTLDRYAQVTGAVKPPERSTNITVINAVPTDADSKRTSAMDELRREAAKLVTIDGELANAGTSLDANRHGGITNELMPAPVPKKGQP